MKNILLLMQGHSGSGKSTFAATIAEAWRILGLEVEICSTDKQFEVDGVYKFDPTKLGAYHAINLKLAIAALEAGKCVIVDNTNTACWEAKPYVEAAQRLGVPVHFRRATGDYQNTHGVPADKVALMKGRLELLSVEACLKAKAPWEK